MSKRAAKNKRTPATAEQIARSTGSPVAVAGYLRGGAGTHGKHGTSRNRADRKAERSRLRRGDWD